LENPSIFCIFDKIKLEAMEQKELEIYMNQQMAALKSQSNMAVAQHWHDVLMKSLEGDTEFEASYQAFLDKYPTDSSVLEKSNSMNLSNPEKLARDYALMSGDSIKIVYMGQTETSYVYTYRVRTKPNIAGEMLIIKKKLDGRVCIEFERQIGGSESRVYEMDEFTDFQTFMGLIVDVIRKFK
jgi:hypothetical protein